MDKVLLFLACAFCLLLSLHSVVLESELKILKEQIELLQTQHLLDRYEITQLQKEHHYYSNFETLNIK